VDTLTRVIAEYAGSLSFRHLPPEIVHATKQRLVDTLACAVGGYGCEAVAIGRRLAQGAVPQRHAGRLLGFPGAATAEAAAFVNTAAIRYLDFNDTRPGGHPSDCLGGLLAIAEAAGASGERFLTAMIVAYEVAVRLIAATQFRERGWDQGFAIGIGTAAGVGNLLGLPADRIAHAVAIATVANVPLRATRAGELSLWKGAATAYACRNGVFAALLAAEGMTGPDQAFEGRHGVWEQITGPFAIEPFADAGSRFVLPTVRFKYWPVEYNAQVGVWAALELRAAMAPADIAEIDIGTYWSAWHEIGSEPAKWDPQTRETADHSLPYIFARVLVDGSISVASFDRSAYSEPSLRPLMAKIRVRQDEEVEALWPATVAVRVAATGTDGRRHTLEVRNPRGHEANPMDDAEIDAKFRALAEPALGLARTAGALDAWRSIERAATLSAALDLLELPASPPA
jgi:2-methylcitrate dehydratase